MHFSISFRRIKYKVFVTFTPNHSNIVFNYILIQITQLTLYVYIKLTAGLLFKAIWSTLLPKTNSPYWINGLLCLHRESQTLTFVKVKIGFELFKIGSYSWFNSMIRLFHVWLKHYVWPNYNISICDGSNYHIACLHTESIMLRLCFLYFRRLHNSFARLIPNYLFVIMLCVGLKVPYTLVALKNCG